MGRTKNKKVRKGLTKKTVNKGGAQVHQGRMRINKSKRACSNDFSRKCVLLVRRTILVVIVLAMISVVLAILLSIFNNPERIIKSKIESITADYYENYFYKKILDNAPSGKTMDEMMERYLERGFSSVPLRQLMLFDSRRHADAEAELYKYCDPDETLIHIYPVEPFGEKDYRVEYKYACIF